MTVLITGASRGIGAEIAAQYKTRGETVIGTSRNGGEWHLDVSDPSSFAPFHERLGDTKIDLLVCNAGVYLDKGHNLETGYQADLWAQSFATNVTGVFLTIQTLRENLADTAKIAIISSQMASDNRAPGGSYIYRASKAAVLNLGRNLAVDLKPQGISVGIYHPGWVQTDMGGSAADIDAAAAAQGLITRFDELSLETTGCFKTWDGQDHPF